MVLTFAVAGGSSIGLQANLVPASNSFIYNTWRSGAVLIFWSIPAILEYHKNKTDLSTITLKKYIML